VPAGVQRLVGIADRRRPVPPPGAPRREGDSNRSEKYESRDGNPGLHQPPSLPSSLPVWPFPCVVRAPALRPRRACRRAPPHGRGLCSLFAPTSPALAALQCPGRRYRPPRCRVRVELREPPRRNPSPGGLAPLLARPYSAKPTMAERRYQVFPKVPRGPVWRLGHGAALRWYVIGSSAVGRRRLVQRLTVPSDVAA
jgi:hypothetical protein